MDRYYTMRPINLSGEVSGYRAELVGVGSGADALRTIIQNAINRVGISITPIVCQQLFIEVFNAAVDFACDSGTSVNLADIVSFKWNTRGKYDRIDAVVPKSALNLTATVSPKITRDALPHFDLLPISLDPEIKKIANPFNADTRGVIARGNSLGNIQVLRFVSASNPSLELARYVRGVSIEISNSGREIMQTGTIEHVNPHDTVDAVVQYSTIDNPTLFSDIARTTLPAWIPPVVVTGATPQPYDVYSKRDLIFSGSGFMTIGSAKVFDPTTGDLLLEWDHTGAGGDDVLNLPGDEMALHKAFNGGPTEFHLFAVDNPSELRATFLVTLSAYSV